MKIQNAPISMIAKPEAAQEARALRQAAEGFEAIFMNTLMKSARAASLGEDLMGGHGVDTIRDMFDAEVTKRASGRSGLGIADAVERQFKPFLDRKA